VSPFLKLSHGEKIIEITIRAELGGLVEFAKPDVFSQANNDDPAARALYYGVQKVPYSMLEWLAKQYVSNYAECSGRRL